MRKEESEAPGPNLILKDGGAQRRGFVEVWRRVGAGQGRRELAGVILLI
jgi:hypothetical protein